MKKNHGSSLLGLIILSAYAFLYLSDLCLSLYQAFRKGNWTPLVCVIALSLCVALLGVYFYLKHEGEQRRKKPLHLLKETTL